ncbi:EAL domain-containing protein [Ferrimonas lipolytica]|uniref:cyclic-guanylate-specific phosphodiesterase n=1 Tax=Ferrimonas lipolytica TaxID=2724191 RepID=A0A6H1UGE2_9GAMM|nr:EAL domain-containing protein [Ferrimonas lipolytica]QIZ78114.1 EAL domain-containing protein [Ferrimonas lipolytica]
MPAVFMTTTELVRHQAVLPNDQPLCRNAQRDSGDISNHRLLCIITRLLTLTLLCFAVVAHATDYRFTALQTGDGLQSNLTQNTYQQRNGFIWIGTDNGISRYDGHHFKHYNYNPKSPQHISNNMITDISEDTLGNIWVGTEYGLNRINADDTVTIYGTDDTAPDGLNSAWILALFTDSKEQLWIGGDAGLSRYEHHTNSFIPYPLIINNEAVQDGDFGFFKIAQTSSGDLFVASSEGLLQIDQNKQSLTKLTAANSNQQPIIADHINIVTATQDGRLLVNTDRFGTHWYDPNTHQLTPISLEHAGTITAITQMDNGDIWFAHVGGIRILDHHGNHLSDVHFDEFSDTSIASDSITHIAQDDSGLIWVATSNGISQFSYLRSPSRLHRHSETGQGIIANSISYVAQVAEQEVWLSSPNGLTKISQPQQFSNFQSSDALRNLDIWSMAASDDGTLWYAASNGLGTIDRSTGEQQHYSNQPGNEHGLEHVDIYTVLPDQQGGAWITGYYNTGLVYFHPEHGLGKRYMDGEHRYTKMGNFSFDTVWGQDGAIWMATTDSIYRVDPNNGEAINFPLDGDRPFMRATDIAVHPTGDIWATSQGAGLIRLSHQPGESSGQHYQLLHISQQLGLENNSFKALTIDPIDPNLVWFISDNELYRYHIKTQQLVSYPSLFEINNLSLINGAMTQLDHLIYIGSNVGLLEIDTRKLQTNRFDAPVHVTGVKVNGKAVSVKSSSPADPIRFDYEDNTIEFQFSALDYTSPQKNRYRYRLIGADQDWIEADNRTSVTYTNLRSDYYQFVVQGSNSDGHWSNIEGNWHFTVRWAWWAWTLTVLIVLLIIFGSILIWGRSKRLSFLNNIAFTDPLTGLANRRKLNDWLGKLCTGKDNAFRVIFIDLDDFKHINDTFGHDIGDEYITSVAKRINLSLRPSDKLARLGGDEFALIIEGKLSFNQSDALMDRLLRVINSEHHLGNHLLKGSASVGVAVYPHDGQDSNTLLKNADTAMYASKRRGKNVCSYYCGLESQQLHQQFNLSSEIFHAIDQQQIQVYYQAKVCCNTGKVVGAEALARWVHPQKGMISPVEFIPVAEANGAIIQIGQCVLTRACQQALLWHQNGLFDGRIAVNVSAKELHQDNFVASVQQVLQQTGLPAPMLELELTETLLVENIGEARTTLTQLRALGIGISLDDFGTGYSSLNYLDELPLDTLKIDRSFIKKITPENDNNLILAGVLDIAKRLQLSVVAEGVETELQWHYLQRHHCQQAQGFLFNKPQSAADFIDYLRSEQAASSHYRNNQSPTNVQPLQPALP